MAAEGSVARGERSGAASQIIECQVPWFVEAPDPKLGSPVLHLRDGNGAGARLRLFRGRAGQTCGGQAAFDEARRVVANIARLPGLPGLLRRKADRA